MHDGIHSGRAKAKRALLQDVTNPPKPNETRALLSCRNTTKFLLYKQ
jgi:hypothetical protein